MDNRRLDLVKKLNRSRDETARLQKQLEEAETQQQQMEKDASDAAATDSGDSPDAEVILSHS